MGHLWLITIGNAFYYQHVRKYLHNDFYCCSKIENVNNELFVIPESEDFETYLNGELVKSKKKMLHGDRLVIGGSHFFRVSNPFCTNTEKKKKVSYEIRTACNLFIT